MNITNDLVTDYINGFYRPSSNDLGKLRLEAEEARVPIILKETESFLRTLLLLHRPARILEIGAAVGYSSSFFAEVLPECKIFTIEKDEKVYETAKQNIDALGFSSRITVLQGDGEEAICQIKEMGEEAFDFVFIDAAKSHYKRFMDASLTVSKPGTLIISDNILMKGQTVSDQYDPYGRHKTNIRNMKNYLDYISSHEKLETSLLSCGDGLAISLVKEI